MASDVQSELVAYLDWFKRRQESEERQKDENRNATLTLTNQMQLLSQKLETVNMIFDERLKGLSARIDALENQAEDTGVHNLRRMESELAEAKAKADRVDDRHHSSLWEIAKIVITVALSVIGGGGAVHAIHLLSH